MEILSFLRLTGRRVVGLSLVAGLAGAGAGYAVTRSPASYQATATVFVGQALPSGSSSFDLPALVADFQAALSLAPVISSTAAAAELAPDDFTVTAARNGDGGTVRIVATAPTAEAAETVASSISLEAMSFVTTRQVERAANLEAQRSADAEASRVALSELDAANGFVDPVAQYATVQAQATQLQLDAENPGSALTDVQRAGQLEQARTLKDSLPQLALKAQQYQSASKTVADSEANVSTATRDRVAAEAVQESATSAETVTADDAAAVSMLPSIMRASGAAVLVTGAAGVGMFALLEDRRRRRTERAAAADLAVAPEELETAPDLVVADTVLTDAIVTDAIVTDAIVTDAILTDPIVTDTIVTGTIVADDTSTADSDGDGEPEDHEAPDEREDEVGDEEPTVVPVRLGRLGARRSAELYDGDLDGDEVGSGRDGIEKSPRPGTRRTVGGRAALSGAAKRP